MPPDDVPPDDAIVRVRPSGEELGLSRPVDANHALLIGGLVMGIATHLGKFYDNKVNVDLVADEAREHFLNGCVIELPSGFYVVEVRRVETQD